MNRRFFCQHRPRLPGRRASVAVAPPSHGGGAAQSFPGQEEWKRRGRRHTRLLRLAPKEGVIGVEGVFRGRGRRTRASGIESSLPSKRTSGVVPEATGRTTSQSSGWAAAAAGSAPLPGVASADRNAGPWQAAAEGRRSHVCPRRPHLLGAPWGTQGLRFRSLVRSDRWAPAMQLALAPLRSHVQAAA